MQTFIPVLLWAAILVLAARYQWLKLVLLGLVLGPLALGAMLMGIQHLWKMLKRED